MDLYGDLLNKTKDAAEGSQQPLLGSSWMRLKTKNQKPKVANLEIVNNNKAPSPAPVVETSSATASSSTAKFLPTSLLFKPRQTNPGPVKSSTGFPDADNIQRTGSNGSGDALHSQKSVLPLSETAEPNAKRPRIVGEQNNISRVKEDALFNITSSFEVDDPYDPRRPNDYFGICKDREEIKRKRQIAEENQRKLEENNRIRADLERQRREAMEKQDYKTLAANASMPASTTLSIPSGRGRGVSNLPAWLVQKMQQEEEEKQSGVSSQTANAHVSQQFSD
jgi:hypothetical protein